MHTSVRIAFTDFSARLEGVVHWMYLDVLGLVTTGIGNLIDPVAGALTLPWVDKRSGERAGEREIRREWSLVKSHPSAARQGHRVLEGATYLRLTAAGIAEVVGARMVLNDRALQQRFGNFELWPADAQLAAHSMAWACGPGFPAIFPRLAKALDASDYASAARECRMREEGNPGIVPRNRANADLFMIASEVAEDGGDEEELRYPVQCVTHSDCAADLALGLACMRSRLSPVGSTVTAEQSLPEAPIVHPPSPLPDR